MRSHVYFAIILLVSSAGIYAQPPHPRGAPGAGPPPGAPPQVGQPGAGAPKPGNWIRPHDENENGILEANEFSAAIARTFSGLDKNGSGILEPEELRPPPMPQMAPPAAGAGPGRPASKNRMLPPFFFNKGRPEPEALTQDDFERQVRSVFAEIDENGDGSLTKEEAGKHLPPHPAQPPPPPGPPNAQFIGAELRFGDKQVRGQPFSAEILIEETKRLFDGSLVTRQTRGAIYRDAAGRTRREQPLEMVGGFPVVGGDSRPQMLVFINDFGTRSHTFLDVNNKVARKSRIGDNVAPPAVPRNAQEAKTESLGTKTIEGVSVEGTRKSFEMPAGHLGNEKPLLVTEERWFSPELQVVILSRHVDPIGGEHVFKLLNIKRVEPVAELFSVPVGFRIEN